MRRVFTVGIPCLLLVGLAGLAGCGQTPTPAPPVPKPLLVPPRKALGTLSGGAWLEMKVGGSDILRGLSVHLLRPTVKRADIGPTLDSLESLSTEALTTYSRDSSWRDELEQTKAYRERLKIIRDAPPKEDVELAAVFALIRSVPLVLDGTENAKRIAFIEQDKSWPSVALQAEVEEITAGVGGKFRFRPVPDGDYLLYAGHSTERNVIEWLVPVTVKGETTQDLFNRNATILLERE